MSRALRELGLGPDADERAVKRAYATRLKVTRPDSDPEGFQRLNSAYQAALLQLASGEALRAAASTLQAEDTAGVVPCHTPATVAASGECIPHIDALPDHPTHEIIREPTAVEEQGHFEFTIFYVELRERVLINDTTRFRHWLQSQQALYDLSLKDRVAEQLVFQLRSDSPLPRNYLKTLLQFFSLDTINAVSWRLQDELHLLIKNTSPSTEHDSDWSDLELDPALRSKPFQESSLGLRILGIFLLGILGILVATWVTNFIRYTLPGYSHTRKTP